MPVTRIAVPKWWRPWVIMAVLAFPILTGMGILWLSPSGCVFLGNLDEAPFELRTLSFRFGAPVCVEHLYDGTLTIKAPEDVLAEAIVDGASRWRAFTIWVKPGGAFLADKGSWLEKRYERVDALRTSIGTIFALFERRARAGENDRSHDEPIEHVLYAELVSPSHQGGLEIRYRGTSYSGANIRSNLLLYRAYYQWDPSFYVWFTVWRRGDRMIDFVERTERIAMKVRAYIESVSEPYHRLNHPAAASATSYR